MDACLSGLTSVGSFLARPCPAIGVTGFDLTAELAVCTLAGWRQRRAVSISASPAPLARAHFSAAASEYLLTKKRTGPHETWPNNGTPAEAVWLSATSATKAGNARLII